MEDLDLVMLMYLLQYSSNCCDTTGRLWFYYKGKATDFSANIVEGNVFKSFKYKAKSLWKTVADGANGISKNTAIAVSLTYLSNFGGHLKCID